LKCEDANNCFRDSNVILSNNQILRINRQTHLKTHKEIKVERGANNISFEIPPRSTVYLKPIYWTTLDSLEHKVIGIIEESGAVADSFVIDRNIKTENVKRTGGILFNNIFYYDYEK
jgi:hypothetical protein